MGDYLKALNTYEDCLNLLVNREYDINKAIKDVPQD